MSDRNKTYLTIMTKNSMFTFLGLVSAQLLEDEGDNKPITAVVKHDPREGQPFFKEYDKSSEAIRNYEEAISTSVERGWNVIFRGTPNYG